MASATPLLPHVDELVMEYLLFRGFTKSFQALAAERKRDRAKAFDVEQLISQLLTFVQTYQIEPLLDSWRFLEARFFSRLDASYTTTIRQLEDSWLRLYVANAIKTGQRDKAVEFFTLLAEKLNAAPPSTSSYDSWHRWFILPYVQNPESDPYFKTFFSKQWLESFVASFRNFLSLIFRSLPLPKLLAFQISRLEEPSLKLRLKASQSECGRLRLQNVQSAERIRKLEDAGYEMNRLVQTMVQHSFAEHFTWAESHNSYAENGAEPNGVTASTLKVLTSLSEQLRDLQHVFGPASSVPASRSDVELEAALLDPLAVKLNSVTSLPNADSDQDAASASADLSSSPSSMSLQSAGSVSSPSRNRPVRLDATLVQEVTLSNGEAGDDQTDGGERLGGRGVCKYAYDGSRMVVSRPGRDAVPIFNIGSDGSVTDPHIIQTESSVVSADWIAKSKCLVYALEDGTVNVWDTDAKARTFIISYNADERWPAHLACARAKAVGAVALVGTSTEDASTSRLQFFAFEDQAMQMLSSVDLDDSLDVIALRWAHDGSVLAIAHSAGQVSLLSPYNARPLCTWQLGASGSSVTALDFTPDGHTLLTAIEADCQVQEWSVQALIAAAADESSQPLAQSTYRLPADMAAGACCLEAHARNPIFVAAGAASEAEGSGVFSVYTIGRPEAIVAAVHVASPLDAMAWHPQTHTLCGTTRAGKLLAWKLA